MACLSSTGRQTHRNLEIASYDAYENEEPMLKITTKHPITFFQYSCSEYGDASSAVIEEQFEVNVTGSHICKRQYNKKIL